MSPEDKIKLAQLHQQLHVIKQTNPYRYDQIMKSYEEGIQNKQREEFFKSWSTDLAKRFPEGSWKTVGGSKVFINNGKVIAGLDGFNKEIDKFFDEKKGKGGKSERESGKNYSSENFRDDLRKVLGGRQSAGSISEKDGIHVVWGKDKKYKDWEKIRVFDENSWDGDNFKIKEFDPNSKGMQEAVKYTKKLKQDSKVESKEKPVNERTKQEIGEAKQKIANTMPKPINEMTWEEFKPYGVKMQKESSHSQPESFYERQAKMEHDWAVKNNKSQYQVTDKQKSKQSDKSKLWGAETKEDKIPTINTFKDIAKQSKDVEDFMSKVREIKNVPTQVSQEFFSKYGGGNKTAREASLAFMKKHSDVFKKPEKDSYKKEVYSKVKSSLDKKFNVSGKYGRESGLPLKGIKEIYTDGEYKGKKVNKDVQKDAEKLLDYANDGDLKGLKEIREKYFSEWNKMKSQVGTQRERYVPVNTAKVELYNLANAMHMEGKKSVKEMMSDLPF